MTSHVFIDGGAGTTGLEIAERLALRDDVTLIRLSDEDRKSDDKRREALNDADVAILCLPDDAARDAVAMIERPETRIIDASNAHRVAAGWTYGFPELVGERAVASASRLSNPGCYASGFIALVAPLVRAGLIAPDACVPCYAVSGYSGGGKAMIAEFTGGAPPTAWRSYALTLAHKHLNEMRHHAGLTRPPLFVPAVAATLRGMVVDVPLFDVAADAARAILTASYAGSPVVRVGEISGEAIAVEHAAGTDRLDLFVFGRADGTQCRLVAALDNLGKGASGAAVQSLNLMIGVPATTGLRL